MNSLIHQIALISSFTLCSTATAMEPNNTNHPPLAVDADTVASIDSITFSSDMSRYQEANARIKSELIEPPFNEYPYGLPASKGCKENLCTNE